MNFSLLPPEAQRAAFAHMDRAKATGRGKKLGSGTRAKKLTAQKNAETFQVINPKSGGGFEIAGRITKEEAAIRMFGLEGAMARITKANAKRRRK